MNVAWSFHHFWLFLNGYIPTNEVMTLMTIRQYWYINQFFSPWHVYGILRGNWELKISTSGYLPTRNGDYWVVIRYIYMYDSQSGIVVSEHRIYPQNGRFNKNTWSTRNFKVPNHPILFGNALDAGPICIDVWNGWIVWQHVLGGLSPGSCQLRRREE